MFEADPFLGISSTYLSISFILSLLISFVILSVMRQRSVASISYKTAGVVFVVVMTMFIMKKLI